MNPVALAAALTVVGAALAWRRHRARTIERQLAARLKTVIDDTGEPLIIGAEPLSFDASPHAAALLLHGGGDTPQTMSALAAALHQAGYTVRVPLMPGHGRTLRHLDRVDPDEWAAAVTREYEQLAATHPRTIIVGLSLGGALALPVAVSHPKLPALVLLAPYLELPTVVKRLVRWAWVWGPAIVYLRTSRSGSLFDAAERGKNRGFGYLPAHMFPAIATTAERGAAALPRVTMPTLVIQSIHDNRVSTDSCRRALAKLGAPVKRLELLDQGGHILTQDVGRERVFALVLEWMSRYVPL